MIRLDVSLTVLLATSLPYAEVEPQAHYNLQGQGGIRDTAAPESRRTVYDSSLKFDEHDQCDSVSKNIVHGDHWVIETWAYASKANDPGLHAVVVVGDGAHGFILGHE
jgi:hypothetical protein